MAITFYIPFIVIAYLKQWTGGVYLQSIFAGALPTGFFLSKYILSKSLLKFVFNNFDN